MNLNKLLSMTKKSTLLGAGPMSKNCVDAAINLANEYKSPIILIASRRQIECEEFGGGYVNNWSTEKFSHYVKSKDKNKKIFLARDHGGPWQGSFEDYYNLRKSMKVAKKSFEVDIDSNFNFLHIDTSIQPNSKVSLKKSLERFYELFEHCIYYSKKKNKNIMFEIGTEEQSGSTNTPEELEYTLNQIKKYCKKNNFKMPAFVVIQSGTKVAEMRNIGSFESPLRIENEIAVEVQLPKMIEICKKYGILMKEHNADYLSNHSLSLHPKLNIHAANIAPEFGVTETKSILNLMRKSNLKKLEKNFLDLSYKSKKWKKWILPKSGISKTDKSILSAHYIFSKKEFINIKKELNARLHIDIDRILKGEIKKSILRYLRNFKLI